MGLTWHETKFLCQLHGAGLRLGRVLTLGRQNLFVNAAKLRQLLIDHAGLTADRAVQLIPDVLVHAEPLLLALAPNRSNRSTTRTSRARRSCTTSMSRCPSTSVGNSTS